MRAGLFVTQSGGVRNYSLGFGQSFGEGQAEEANRCSRCWGRAWIDAAWREVGAFGGRLEVGGRLCDDDGCDLLSIGSSQSTPVYQVLYRTSVPSSQSQSSLVPPPVCLPVCLSVHALCLLLCGCLVGLRQYLRYGYVLQPIAGWACQAQACSRFSYGCATERITDLCKPRPTRLVWSCFRLQVSLRSLDAA